MKTKYINSKYREIRVTIKKIMQIFSENRPCAKLFDFWKIYFESFFLI